MVLSIRCAFAVLFLSAEALAECVPPVLAIAPTAVERTFIRQNYGEWNAPRKDGTFHRGVDLLVRASYPDKMYYAVHSIAAGTVAYAELNGTIDSGYGNTVVIDHGDGCYSLYAHLAHEPMSLKGNQTHLNVKIDDRVTAGQVIGYMVRPEGVASTGNARDIDVANRHQVHFALIDAPTGRRGPGRLGDTILAKPGMLVDPTALLTTAGLAIMPSVGDDTQPRKQKPPAENQQR